MLSRSARGSSTVIFDRLALHVDEEIDEEIDGSHSALDCSFKQAGTKVGPDQLGSPVRVGSTRIDSDRLES